MSSEASKPAEFLTGPRETGTVPLGAGRLAVHEITADGMKQLG